MPTISVIVPVYKVEQYIHRCVDSILAQTFRDFELILVDDGSPDNCPAICDEYAAKDSRVVVIHQKNGGLSAARNAGIDWAFAHSDSQWLTFIDSDDWVHSEYLDVLLHIAIQHQVDCSICETQKVYSSSTYYRPIGAGECFTSEDAYRNHYNVTIIACAKLYKKSLFSDIRFPLGRLHEDAFTTYRILFNAKYVTICWDELYFYYQNPNGIMNSPWTPKRIDEIDAHEEQICFLRKHNFPNALIREMHVYIRVLARHIVDANAAQKYSAYAKIIKKKLRKTLVYYRWELNYPVTGNEWVYENAFPYVMKIYWVFKALQRRIHNAIQRR